jgi:hypothetical protein
MSYVTIYAVQANGDVTEWPSPRMSHTENVLLGSTFDNVWVARDALPELIKGWERFLDQYIQPHKLDERAAVGIIAALREVLGGPSNRGVAFNMCSANESPWDVEDQDGGDFIPFNIDHPPADSRAWELTERMREAAQEPPA